MQDIILTSEEVLNSFYRATCNADAV